MMIVCTVIFTTLIGGSIKEEAKQVVKVSEMKERGY